MKPTLAALLATLALPYFAHATYCKATCSYSTSERLAELRGPITPDKREDFSAYCWTLAKQYSGDGTLCDGSSGLVCAKETGGSETVYGWGANQYEALQVARQQCKKIEERSTCTKKVLWTSFLNAQCQ